MNMPRKKQALIFILIHHVLFAVSFSVPLFGIGIIPNAKVVTDWINGNITLIFWFLLILHSLCFVIYIIYIYCNNLYIDEKLEYHSNQLKLIQDIIKIKLGKYQDDVSKQNTKQAKFNEKNQELLECYKIQYLEIKHSIKDIKKDVSSLRKELIQKEKQL